MKAASNPAAEISLLFTKQFEMFTLLLPVPPRIPDAARLQAVFVLPLSPI